MPLTQCKTGLCNNQLGIWAPASLLLAILVLTAGQPPILKAPGPDLANYKDYHYYYLTVQLGGEDAHAVAAVLQIAEDALASQLAQKWEGCKLYNAWNVSSCENGAPIPTAFFTVLDQGLLPAINRSPAPSPLETAGLMPAAGERDGQGQRRLLDVTAPEASQDEEYMLQAAVPSASECLPQMDIVFQLMSESSVENATLNETALSFKNGAFLAKMQASNVRLEQAVLLNLTQTDADDQPNALGSVPGGSELYILSPDPNVNQSNATFVQIVLNLVGEDAKVTNDGVLGALYSMVTNPSYNGGCPWLTGANTAIVDVRQGPAPDIRPDPASAGRRRLTSDGFVTFLTRQRRLDEGNAPVPAIPADAIPSSLPSLAITLKVQNVPDLDISEVKDAANTLVTGSRLVDGFKARGIGIVAVELINFNYTTAQPPPPPLLIQPRNTHRTVVILVIAIVIPVCVLGAIFIGCSIVWWGRLSRGRMVTFQPVSSLGSASKERQQDSERSPESLGLLMPELRPDTRHDQLRSPAQIQLLDMPWNDWKIEPSELTILTKPDGNKWLLGTGASGTVYKALRNGVQIVAVKLFKEEVTRGAINSLNSWSHAAQFRREISILKSCHDRNIVQFIGACLAEGQTSLVTEFLENGDLYRAINSPQGSRYHWYRLTSPDGRILPNSGMARRVALDVARGLHFLHTRKIVHFDLKSANILLARDFTAKIADVGLAKVLHDDVLSCRREVGTFAWAAPEVLLGQKTTEAADIYSYGVLLHELSAQESPRDRQLRRLRVPEEVPTEIDNLIMRCLNIRAEERPTARDLVALLSCLNITHCHPI